MPGSTWEGSEAVLDASWTSLRWLLAALGWLVGPLGRFLAASWALSGATWLISGAFWVHFNSPRRSEPRFWRVWEHAGLGFRRLGRHVLACTSLRLAFHNIMLFMNAVNHAFAFTCALFSSLPVFCITYERLLKVPHLNAQLRRSKSIVYGLLFITRECRYSCL